jgi:hypothetical protein
LEDLGENRRVVFKWIFNKWDGEMDWLDLAQYRKAWTVL